MKVFIADDEIYVIELLLHLIDWDGLGLEVVGTAKDGSTALEKIKETSPDIVITDIRMPGINGLDMIKTIQEQNGATAFVIISGHNNFEYAQTAIRYGVKDYILKPINADELTEILVNLTSEIHKNCRDREKFSDMNVKFDTAKQKLHSGFLEKITEGLIAPADNMDSLNAEYLLDFRPGNFQFLIMKFDCKYYNERNDFPEQLHERVIFNICQYLEKISFETIAAVSTSKYYVLVNYDPVYTLKLQQNLQYFLDDMQHLCKKYSNLYFTICKGSAESEFARVCCSYNNALCSMRARILSRLDTVIGVPDAYDPFHDLNRIFTLEAKENFRRSLERFDIHEIHVQITRLFTVAESLGTGHAELFWNLSSSIYELFLDVTQNLNLFSDCRQEMTDFLNSLDYCIDIRAIRTALIERITGNINDYTSLEDSSDNAYISIAKKYIVDHYMEKISLDDIAQLLFLNSAYFSILFKQEVGINFVDYLNQYRIEIAKKYLRDISKSLSEISDLVGFGNTKYFSKIFKRIVGITPSQYRSKYLRHNHS